VLSLGSWIGVLLVGLASEEAGSRDGVDMRTCGPLALECLEGG